ncbi:hypothetical protein [Bradyrhizobium sp. UFLA05-112]
MTFERASANADFTERGPVPGLLIGRFGDPAAILPETARSRRQALLQRREDAAALSMPMAEAVNELRIGLQREQARQRQLVTPRSSGGFGLQASTEKGPTADIQVRDVERRIAAISEELRRKQVLLEDRSARTNNIGRLCERIEAWLNGGVPGGNRIVDHGEIDVVALKQRGETSEAATLERLRRRLRELAADWHRVQSAPRTSSEAIADARAQIEALAQRGEPDFSALIEVGGAIGWPQVQQRLPLVGLAINEEGEARLTGVAQGEVIDQTALNAWFDTDKWLAKAEKRIREQCDDKVALSQQDRAEKLAEIASDQLEAERAECALIWKLQRDGQAVEFRDDADIRAVLGISLEVDDRPQRPFGQAADYSHVIDVIR